MTTRLWDRNLLGMLIVVIALHGVSAGEVESPLLTKFKSRQEEIVKQVSQGALPKSVAQHSEKLWLSLRKNLIYLDAKGQAYQLDVKESAGALQDKAIKNLVAVSGERERLLMDAIQRLDKLAGGEPTEIPVFFATDQTAPAAPAKQEARSSDSVTISIEPEDLTNPQWD